MQPESQFWSNAPRQQLVLQCFCWRKRCRTIYQLFQHCSVTTPPPCIAWLAMLCSISQLGPLLSSLGPPRSQFCKVLADLLHGVRATALLRLNIARQVARKIAKCKCAWTRTSAFSWNLKKSRNEFQGACSAFESLDPSTCHDPISLHCTYTSLNWK